MDTYKLIDVAGDAMRLMDSSVTFPQTGRVACQGVRGAYSEQAAKKMFHDRQTMFFRTFGGVVDAVKSGMCDFGILPIENNSYGSVRQVYQILKHAGVYIVRAERLMIRHELLVKPGTKLDEITTVRSHEQALGQCARFIRSIEDHVAVVPMLNTAAAARFVAESDDPGEAAIASPEAAEEYGLQALSTRVSDSDNNYTRFVCISRDPLIYPGANKMSMILSLEHRPGALYELLGRFAALGVNVLKLESCPIVGRDFEFLFYIDVEASAADERVRDMLGRIRRDSAEMVFLGNYQEG